MAKTLSYYLFYTISLIFISFVSQFAVAAEEKITGLAIQEKLRVPVYYAATSGYPPKSLADYINNPMPFKMEARYIVDKFSARRNNQLWLNAILTSNSRDELKTFEQALLRFSKLIKTDMYKGDRLVFDLNPVKGTSVSINGINLGTISDLNFQSALVSIWFGSKQPSKKFAEQIRKAPSSSELKAFNDLKVQSKNNVRLERLQTAMLETGSTTAEVVAVATPKAKVPAVKSNSSNQNNTQQAQKKPISEGDSQSTKQNEQAKVAQSATNKTSKSSDSQQTTNQPQSQTPAKKAPEKTPVANVKVETPKSKPVTKQKPKVEKTQVAKVEPLSVVDQMFNSLRSDYRAELKQYIEQNARPVPPIRVRKKPKGEATLRITLVNKDNKPVVQDSTTLQSEFDDNLMEAVHSAVKRLKSMPPIPQAIADSAITVDVTLNFAKCKRSTSTWICF